MDLLDTWKKTGEVYKAAWNFFKHMKAGKMEHHDDLLNILNCILVGSLLVVLGMVSQYLVAGFNMQDIGMSFANCAPSQGYHCYPATGLLNPKRT